MSKYIFIFTLMTSLFSVSCANIFSEFADQDSDEAISKDVEILMDKGNYAAALTKYGTLSASFRAERSSQFLLAKIHAGLCGLDFLELSSNLGNLGSNTLFTMLMGAFPGATAATVTSCIDAEGTILSISTDGTQRTTSENLLMAYISWAKIGNILSLTADADDDGSTDGSFDACNTGDLDSTNARHVATGLANMLDGLANIGSSNVGSDQLSGIGDLCDLIDSSLGAAYNFCNFKEISGITADMESGVRSVVQENRDLGIGGGSCPDGSGMDDDPINCVCP